MPQPKTETVELCLPDEALLSLALAAHRRDITLNELMTDIMRDAVANTFEENGVCLYCYTKAPLTRHYCSVQCEVASHSSP